MLHYKKAYFSNKKNDVFILKTADSNSASEETLEIMLMKNVNPPRTSGFMMIKQNRTKTGTVTVLEKMVHKFAAFIHEWWL